VAGIPQKVCDQAQLFGGDVAHVSGINDGTHSPCRQHISLCAQLSIEGSKLRMSGFLDIGGRHLGIQFFSSSAISIDLASLPSDDLNLIMLFSVKGWR
jgi:hypothetical protein